ncbi:MAG: 30S ribosomal protein S6 [Polyangiaceae bacterium]|nr:30S ribosomal protein S6 [Polyangiaceae bacterium]
MSSAAAAKLPPRSYEVIYILRPDISKEAAERVAQRVTDVVSREGGVLTLVENWGRRPLAYDIAHKRRGLYVYINYLGDGALVTELERNFRMIDEVIRFQTVKLEDAPESGEIDPELLKFEVEEFNPEEEVERTLEQELGLVNSPAPRPSKEEFDAETTEESASDDVEAAPASEEKTAESVEETPADKEAE